MQCHIFLKCDSQLAANSHTKYVSYCKENWLQNSLTAVNEQILKHPSLIAEKDNIEIYDDHELKTSDVTDDHNWKFKYLLLLVNAARN